MKGGALDITPVDPTQIPRSRTGGRGRSVYLETVKAFLLGKFQAAEIDVPAGNSPEAVANQIRVQIRQARLDKQVTVCVRGGRAFLMRVAP